MAETMRQRLIRGYAWSIYIDGYRKFEDTNASYHEEIKMFAAANFQRSEIDHAFNNAFINQQQYDDTIAYITPA